MSISFGVEAISLWGKNARVMDYLAIDKQRATLPGIGIRNKPFARCRIRVFLAACQSEADDDTLLRVDEALARLAEEDPLKAQLVKLRFFVGLSIPEAGRTLGFSESTTKRHWAYARAWLYYELKNTE